MTHRIALTFLLASISLAISVDRARAADDTGFKSLFDGHGMSGWDGDGKYWSVKDGAIVGETKADNLPKQPTDCVWKLGKVDDFDLRCSIRATGDTANAGVRCRAKENKGQEPRVADGHLAELRTAGKSTAAIDPGEWNELEIIAQGNNLVQKINGQVTADITAKDEKQLRSGALAIELPADKPARIEVKNIRLKRLKLGDRKKVVMVAGTPSHGKGEHEFNAGSLLLKKCLDENAPQVVAEVYLNGWPADPTAFDNADAIMIYADGGGGHPAVQGNRLQEIDQLTKKGVGILCAHYAVEVEKAKGGPEFERWIGGYFETFWSINPTWMMTKPTLAKDHPITRGVKPFDIHDEWYYHMRFLPNMEGVTPILSAVPPDDTRRGGDDAHGGNAHVRADIGKNVTEILSWAVERPDGGRGYGFTGGHYHKNWGNDDYRKLMLNAILWVAKADVPANGVESHVTEDELKANLDKK